MSDTGQSPDESSSPMVGQAIPGPTVQYLQTPPVVLTPPPAHYTDNQRPFPHAQAYQVLGIVHVVAGAFVFVLEVAGISLIPPRPPASYRQTGLHYQYVSLSPRQRAEGFSNHQYGSGIYSGVCLIIVGILSIFAGKRKTSSLVLGTFVMSIVACGVTLISLCLSSYETSERRLYRDGYRYFYEYVPHRHPLDTFNRAKAGIVVLVCVIEFLVLIVQSSLFCRKRSAIETATPMLQMTQMLRAPSSGYQPIVLQPQPVVQTAVNHAVPVSHHQGINYAPVTHQGVTYVPAVSPGVSYAPVPPRPGVVDYAAAVWPSASPGTPAAEPLQTKRAFADNPPSYTHE